ncbi:perforin-1 isoform X2 [Esox lucius]|uniref:Perforin-1-like n=1 Tax=Esox lucius TaxID=8010 RepID=A0A6Q2XLF5_ESOLU|nr:perforin-1 isoform X3 [Esox lucius]XP_010866854.4 perforin-1 isoform X2 [Esox lucius]
MSVLQTTVLTLLGLWGAWIPPVLPSCTTGQPVECSAAQSAPGTNLAGEGFDVVTMERKQAYVVDVDNWRKTQNGTCTLCVNPFMEGQTPRLPVAVVDWRPTQQCHMKISSTVYDSSEAFVNQSQTEVDDSWMIGLDLITPQAKGSVMVGGTHSRSAKRVMDQSKQDKYSFIKLETHCSYYSYRLIKDPPLHPEFSRSLGLLPPLYNTQTKAEYTRFLATFGTHYIRKVQLGGRVKSVTSLRVCEASLKGYNENEVKDCLEVEASVATSTETAEVKTETKFCKNDLKIHDTKESFSSMFNDRFTEVVGGQTDGATDLLFSRTGGTSKGFTDWAKTLKTVPDIISYSLHPLHLLVKHASKRAGLKKAVEDYILEHALVKHCSGKCKSGSKPSAHDSCQCVCQASKEMNRQCCPQEKGLARLTVTMMYAKDLYGDTSSETDGFVKVVMGSETKQTGVIEGNDNPRWDETLVFNTVKLSLASELKFEVYDEDIWWFNGKDDLLGECIVRPVKAGSYNNEMCSLNHGNLFYSYMVECFPGLGGPTCGEYRPSPMNSALSGIYTSRNALNMTQDLLAHIRMVRSPVDPLAFMMKQKANDQPRLSLPSMSCDQNLMQSNAL